MIWPEIKKAVNSNISTPLNHLMWLNDYKTFGEDSYVFQDKDILHELYRDYELCMNDSQIRDEAFEYHANKNSNIGKALGAIYGVDTSGEIANLNSFDDIFNSQNAIRLVGKNPISTQLLVTNETARNELENNENALFSVLCEENMLNQTALMEEVTSNGKMLSLLAKSKKSWDKKKPFIMAVNKNISYIKNVYDILQDTTYFNSIIKTSAKALDSLEQYTNDTYAANGIIACTLCYYSSYDVKKGIRMKINGDMIKELYCPEAVRYTNDVTTYNVNAIAIPTATFEEIVSGWAAIAVYTAK